MKSETQDISKNLVVYFLSLLAASTALAQSSMPNSEINAHSNWGLVAINAEGAYRLGITGKGVRVGILDTGIALDHPAFVYGNHTGLEVALPGYLHVLMPEMYGPEVGAVSYGGEYLSSSHGTHVGGIIAASKDRGEGARMHGVAYGSQLISGNWDMWGPLSPEQAAALEEIGQQVLERCGDETFQQVTAKIQDDAHEVLIPRVFSVLKDSSTRVINHSWGTIFSSDTEIFNIAKKNVINQSVIQVAMAVAQKGILQVWGAGNEAHSDPAFEASLPYWVPELTDYWLTVVSTNQENKISEFSHRCGIAANWCLAAPGDDIYSSVIVVGEESNDYVYQYREDSGTSMAAPHVTGALALVMERFPYLDNRDIREVVLTTATDIGPAEIYGQGLLNVEKAMKGPGKFRRDWVVNVPLDPCATQQDKHCNVWSNAIAGVGGLTKAGEGALVLSGDNTYSGMTYGQAGRLIINGRIRSRALVIDHHAWLRGSGQIESPTYIAGTIAPGNSAGTLIVNAPLQLGESSRTVFDIDGLGTGSGAGNYSRLWVAGTSHRLTLNGSLEPRLRGITGDASNTFIPLNNTRFSNVLSAAGGFEGGFTALIQSDGLAQGTRFDLLFTQQQADLLVSANTLPGMMAADNAAAGAHLLNQLRDKSIAWRPGGYNTWLGKAINGDPMDLTYRSVGGQIYADSLAWGNTYQDQLGQIMLDQMAIWDNKTHIQNTGAVWLKTPYIRTHANTDGHRLEAKTQMSGALLGMERRWETSRLGGAMGWIDGEVTEESHVARAKLSGFSISTYGRYTLTVSKKDDNDVSGERGSYVVGRLTYTQLNAKHQRHLSALSASYRSQERIEYGAAEVGMGNNLHIADWRFNPELSFRLINSRRAGVDESSEQGNEFALSVPRSRAMHTRAIAQLRMSRVFSLSKGLFIPQWTIGMQQSLGSVASSRATLTHLEQLPIEQKTALDASTLFRVGLGLDLEQAYWHVRARGNLSSSIGSSSNIKGVDASVSIVWKW